MGDFRYFSSVEGHAVQRHGSVVFIGAVKTPQGFVWDTDDVVRIPPEEYERHEPSYRRSLADGALVVRTAEDFERRHGPKVVAAAVAKAVEAANLEDVPTRETRVSSPSVDAVEDAGPQGPATRAERRGRRLKA